MKILELKSSNIKRLKAIELTLDEKQNLVFITGRNAQGKTSVLDSIWYALGGTKIAPEKPIREGQEEAKIELDLGDYKVTRTYTEKGSYLKVENNEGAKYSNPQDLLNKIVGQLSFDPLEFARMEAKKQVATLVNLTGLDFSELDEQKKKLTEERQFAGRELKGLGEIGEETVKAAEANSKKSEVNITELAKKIQDAQFALDKFQQSRRDMESCKNTIVSLQNQIKTLEQQIEVNVKQFSELEKLEAPKVNIAELQTQLDNAEKENSEIREGKRIMAEAAAKVAKQKQYDDLSKELALVDMKRDENLKAAKMPIEGLSFTEIGVLYNGIPFEQLSAAEQLKVSMAMAIASNPKLKVILIRDASLLDKDNITVITELAKEFDFQVWLEKVDDTGKVGVYIEDGEIKSIDGNELPKTA